MSDREHLDLAARLAFRAAGDVEPNPMVGAVIVKDGRIIGMGHHKKYGGLHAEREALADCGRRGEDPRGATVYCTLEPCRHFGKQPPCTDALVEAGVARVIAARPDPNPISGGGAEVLSKAGIPCEFSNASPNAVELSAPFIKRITTGLPWVIAKWAQFADGRLVTGPDEPRWISGEVARRRVHRLRSRVDAIVAGIGTVLADDPRLTARGLTRVRRVARRVVLDPRLRMPLECALVKTVGEGPVMVVARADLAGAAGRSRSDALARAGVSVVSAAADGEGCDLGDVLRLLGAGGATNVLLECGSRLLGAFFRGAFVDECIVHIGSRHLDERAGREAAERAMPALGDAGQFGLSRVRWLGGDTELCYRRASV